MSVFVLIVVIVNSYGLGIQQQGIFDTMAECFDAREEIVESLGRPIQNYQAVCVHFVEEE